MAIQIGNYNFDGPFTTTGHLLNRSGVYAILSKNRTANAWSVVDIGESGDVRERIENHDRKDCWSRQNQGELAVAAVYVNEAQRTAIERELRVRFNPPCGLR